MDLQWGMNRPPDYQGSIDSAFGEINKMQQRNALAGVDMNNPDSINALLKDPLTMDAGIRLGGMARQNRQDAQQQQDRVGERHLQLAKLFDGATAADWGQRVNMARQIFQPDEIDDLPTEYDQNAAQSMSMLVRQMGGTQERAPTGYRWDGRGALVAIPGGPADKPDIRIIPNGGRMYEIPRGYTQGSGYIDPSKPAPQPMQQGVPENVPAIMETASRTKRMTPQQVETVASQLGPNGQQALRGWMQQNGIVVEAGQVPPPPPGFVLD